MAIKPCKECGNPVSDKAEACPKCGLKNNKHLPRWIVWLVFIVLFVILFKACQFGSSDPDQKPNQNQQLESNSQIPTPQENWQNQESSDEMRGTKSNTTVNISTNEVDFGFPYNGGSKLGLMVRNNSKEKDIMIKIDKGQFICGIVDGCEVNFKFDNGSVQSISMIGSDSHDSDLLFVAHAKTVNSLIQKLKTANKLTIEPKFYQEGARQFNFNVQGFIEP